MGFRVLFLVLLLLPIAYASTACELPGPTGFLQDTDCDGIPDFDDNCPYTANSQQHDANRNAVGDSCDHIVTIVDFTPSTYAQQGDIITMRATLYNTRPRPIENLQLKAYSEELDINLLSTIPSLFSGEQQTLDFIIKIPACAPTGKQNIALSLDYEESGVLLQQTNFETINIQGGDCDSSRDSTTLLETILYQQVLAGEAAIYPLRITNLESTAKTYDITVHGLEESARYRIEPDSRITVPSGRSENLYLYVETYEQATPGNMEFTLQLETDTVDTTLLGLRIMKEAQQQDTKLLLKNTLEIALIVLVVALIIGSIILAIRRGGER